MIKWIQLYKYNNNNYRKKGCGISNIKKLLSMVEMNPNHVGFFELTRHGNWRPVSSFWEFWDSSGRCTDHWKQLFYVWYAATLFSVSIVTDANFFLFCLIIIIIMLYSTLKTLHSFNYTFSLPNFYKYLTKFGITIITKYKILNFL